MSYDNGAARNMQHL